jgi:hypothetical protein
VNRLLHIVSPIKLELWPISTYILSGFASRKCFLKQQCSGGGFLKYINCIIRCHYSINKNKVILCDNTAFCDEEQTELLRDSPNFDRNVGID